MVTEKGLVIALILSSHCSVLVGPIFRCFKCFVLEKNVSRMF